MNNRKKNKSNKENKIGRNEKSTKKILENVRRKELDAKGTAGDLNKGSTTHKNVSVETHNNPKNIKEGRKKKQLTKEEIIKKKKSRRRKLICVLIIFIILLIMFCISLFKWNKIIKDIIICENSVVLDSTGNVIAVLGETRIQEFVPLNKIPKNLVNAYISIEDKNFYKHHGISVKRTGGAILTYITHKGESSFGGSTITQQLVKNVTGENESSISRKITEWDRSIKTEMLLSKDEIMQTYLNIIYVGPNIYGVEMGAKYYFDKDVWDLDLAECAFLAGLNHSPNSYNPYGENDNEEKIKTRSKVVLNVMLEENYISRADYDNAIAEINEGLSFKKGEVEPKGDGVYSYMVDATVSEVVADLAKEEKISTTFATNYLYFSGLKIYCTQNSDIQKDIEDEFSKTKYMVSSSQNKDATAQAAMVVIDHENGQVKGCVRWIRQKNIYTRI